MPEFKVFPSSTITPENDYYTQKLLRLEQETFVWKCDQNTVESGHGHSK